MNEKSVEIEQQGNRKQCNRIWRSRGWKRTPATLERAGSHFALWRRAAWPRLGVILLSLALTLPVIACEDDGDLGEAVEEVGDEASDAAEEVEDEVDDRT